MFFQNKTLHFHFEDLRQHVVEIPTEDISILSFNSDHSREAVMEATIAVGISAVCFASFCFAAYIYRQIKLRQNFLSAGSLSKSNIVEVALQRYVI